MSQTQHLKDELQATRQLLEMIEEEYNKGETNEDGDYVISDESNIRIRMLFGV